MQTVGRGIEEKRATVWVLDDISLEAELVATALRDRYTVETFTGAAAMLERLAIAEPSPDLLIVDWYMPELAGPDVCRFVRRTTNEARLPIVLLTVAAGRDALIEGLASGANDFATKPFEPAELNARVATLIRTKRLHDDLERAEAELQAEGAVRDRFIAILGHDLRQPLNTVRMATAILERGTLAASEAKVVARLTNASRRMQRMVEELLDFSRIRHGGIPMAPKPCDVNAVVEQLVADLRVAHPTCDLRMTTNGPADGMWDRDRIEQLIGNLVGNAIQHGIPECPILVNVSGGASDVTIEVVNEGPPMSAELVRSLFTPFTHGHRVSSGLGLGLFIANQIARAHGGSIAAASDEASTRFTVKLPRGV
jgi:two-component system sensor histidine kinase/response regulator